MHGRRTTLPTASAQPPVATQHLSVRQRLRNDWASQNIAQPMINGKVVDRKRSGDSNGEGEIPQSSKRRRVNSTASEERGVPTNVAEKRVQQTPARQDSGSSTNVENKDQKKPYVRYSLAQYREMRGVQNVMERRNDGRTYQNREYSHGNMMEKRGAKKPYYTNSPYMSPKEMTEGYPDDGTAAVPYETLIKLNPADPLELKRMIWNYYMLP